MDCLFRRGGTWWTRLVVPVRLRQAAGRREFTKSTGVHDCEKPFSEVVEAYCTRPDELAQTLASEHERRHRMADMNLLFKFQGYMPLGQIDTDTLRTFRERTRGILDHANRLLRH
jgi:hypothetical protein